MVPAVLSLPFMAGCLLVAACGDGEREVTTGGGCPPVTVTADGRAEDDMYLRGSWNGWDLSTPMQFRDGRWEASVALAPGDYGYQFYAKRTDAWTLDPETPLTIFFDGQRSSRLTVVSCNYPTLAVVGRPSVSADSYRLDVQFTAGAMGAGIDLAKSIFMVNGKPVTPRYDETSKVITIEQAVLGRGQYRNVLDVRDTAGFAARTLYAPVWIEPQAFDWRDAVIYQIMTDRFLDGDPSNNAPVSGVDSKANWQGGDFAGITQKIEEGYFDALGVNALWISSPVAAAQRSGKGMGGDPHDYAAYHAYWPVGTGWTDLTPIPGLGSPVEPHFGTGAGLHALMDAAHARGIRVMFDFVPNHVHIDGYLWRTHRYDGWFNVVTNGEPANANGGYTCGWERPIECWFADYLPDIDHRNTNAADAIIAHALWLIREFGPDGLRIDAVRLMIPDFTAYLKTAVQREVVTAGVPFYMVGETFTNDRGWDEIGYYLGKDRLDGQFDFPLFHHLSRAALTRTETLADLAAFTAVNDTRYQTDFYAEALMSAFIGNHDLCRALSVANGDFDGTSQGGAPAAEKAWGESPVTPTDEAPYRRLRMALAFLLTSPGVPAVYQGDELGMPGANDPDNRRMMVFGGALNAAQKATLAFTATLGTIRKAHPALRRGTRSTLAVEDDLWVYRMNSGDDRVIIGLNRAGEAAVRDVALESGETGLEDALEGGIIPVSGGSASITLPAEGVGIFVVR